MYTCKVVEFPTNALVGVALGKKLFYSDRLFVYDDNLLVRFQFPPENCFSYGDSDGVWVNCGRRISGSSKLISPESWREIATYKNHCSNFDAKVGSRLFSIEKKFGSIFIVLYSDGKEIKRESIEGSFFGGVVSGHEGIFVRTFDGSILCFDYDLKEKWRVINNKEIISNGIYLCWPISYKDKIIVNVGVNNSHPKGKFELNAYFCTSGELAWSINLDDVPSCVNLVEDELYISVGDRFLKANPSTGHIEMDVMFDYKTFDGQSAPVGLVYPVSGGLLCFNFQNHFIELRNHDGVQVLQTIKLPETYSFHLSEPPPVIFHENKIYFSLGHLVPALNPMKSAVAVLEHNASASSYEEAKLEERPPHQIQTIKDGNGKNGYLVKMSGDNPDKIIRYSHIILKELAFRSGKTSLIAFETRDPDNAGSLSLEIDIKDLPNEKSLSEWEEYFAVLKSRVENDLSSNDVKAGDGESDYKVTVSVVS